MITRRGFLIASASLVGGWSFIDVATGRLTQARGLAMSASSAASLSLPTSPRSPAPAAPESPRSSSSSAPDAPPHTLFVIDARLASVCSLYVNHDNSATPSIMRLDGDVAELWQRVIRPVLVRQPPSLANERERRASYIEGRTSHADSFVLSTLCAEYGFAYRALPDAASPISHVDYATDASFDVVAWRLALAGQ